MASPQKWGYPLKGDLNPAIIARLKESHKVALDLYLIYKPSMEERYFRVDSLPFSEDGIHYTNKKQEINLQKLPLTVAWLHTNLVSGSLNSDLEKIRAWFSNSFFYSLTPGSLRPLSPLDEFLFESRKGFCEHYAASLATLLRLRGYKARVSVGYAIGRWNPFFRLLTYEESDAHAWVEVVDPGTRNWRILDPTNWVLPGEADGQKSDMVFWILAIALCLFLGLILFLAPGRAKGSDAILNKINAMEQKHRLESAGFTLSERLERLVAYYPDRADLMRRTLSIYLAAFYAGEPTPAKIRELDKSVSKWT